MLNPETCFLQLQFVSKTSSLIQVSSLTPVQGQIYYPHNGHCWTQTVMISSYRAIPRFRTILLRKLNVVETFWINLASQYTLAQHILLTDK